MPSPEPILLRTWSLDCTGCEASSRFDQLDVWKPLLVTVRPCEWLTSAELRASGSGGVLLGVKLQGGMYRRYGSDPGGCANCRFAGLSSHTTLYVEPVLWLGTLCKELRVRLKNTYRVDPYLIRGGESFQSFLDFDVMDSVRVVVATV